MASSLEDAKKEHAFLTDVLFRGGGGGGAAGHHQKKNKSSTKKKEFHFIKMMGGEGDKQTMSGFNKLIFLYPPPQPFHGFPSFCFCPAGRLTKLSQKG